MDDTSEDAQERPAGGGSDAGAEADPAAGAPGASTPDQQRRLTLIGTGHVFRIEDTIKGAVHALRPDIVFVELDQGRFQALMHRRATGEMPQGRGGFIQGRLAKFQESVAGMYGAEVGGEMVAAIEGARDIQAKVGLIDRPAEVTVKRALKELTLRERLRAAGQVVQAGFKRLIGRAGQADMEAEIGRYQDDPAAMLEELRGQFPTVYRVVIQERDEHMSARINAMLTGCGVAVVGDGHVSGMLQHLAPDIDVTTYRLAAVRSGDLPKARVADGRDVSFGFNVDVPPQDP